jgi:hypothetical protein
MDSIKIKSNARGKKTASKGMELTGDLLTGDTFPARDYIKTYCDAKWDAERKGWIVNVEKLMALLNTPGAMLSINND